MFTRSAALTLCLASLSSCWIAAMANSKPSASVAFADENVPPGTGWLCFVRSDLRTTETLCERSASACEESRAKEQRTGKSVTVCRAQPAASCYFIDTDPTQAAVLFPVGEKQRLFGCFGSPEECQSFRDDYAQHAATGNGVMAVSACRTLD